MLVVRCYKVFTGVTVSVDYYPPPQQPGNPDRHAIVLVQATYPEESADTPIRLAQCILRTMVLGTDDERQQMIRTLDE